MPLSFSADFPRSLRKFAETEAARLGLTEWRIEVYLADGEQLDSAHGGGHIGGDTTIEVPWRHAYIRLRRDAPRAEQKRTICHEMRHLQLSPLSLVVRRGLRGRINRAKLLNELADAEETLIETELNARTWR